MSMQDYLFFSYAKKLHLSKFKYKEELRKGKRLTRGLSLTSAQDSYLHSERFRSEFGPSFDCMEVVGPHKYFIGQYTRLDRNEKKTYAIVTFDNETHNYITKFLPFTLPREGRFYHHQLAGSAYDLHVEEEKIHVRRVNPDKDVLGSYNLGYTRYSNLFHSNREDEIKYCSMKHPRLGQFLLNHFCYLSDDNTLCAFDLHTGRTCSVAVDVDFFMIQQPNNLLLFTKTSCLLLFVGNIPLSDPIKEQIARLQMAGHHGKHSRDLLELGVYRQLSFVRASETGVAIGKNQIVTVVQAHEDFFYLVLFDTETGQNCVQFLRLAWEYGASKAFGSTQAPKVLRHSLTSLGAKTIEQTCYTSPITLAQPLLGVLPDSDVKVCLFLENTQYHLFFVCGTSAGRLLTNQYIGSLPDDEIYGCLRPSASSVLLYGWNICHELKVSF